MSGEQGASTLDSIFAISNLHAGYGSIRVLKGISLYVGKGEAVALVGANGAGKTTALRAAFGLVSILAGEIRLEGRLLNGLGSSQIARAGLAMVPEGRQVFPNLSVHENLIVGSWTRTDRDPLLLKEAYSIFPELSSRRKQRAGTLSGGEQQMLALARALIAHPKMLLVDEPSMGLAPKVVDRVYDVLRQVSNSGTAILLVEQNVDIAFELCSRGYVIENGTIVLEGNRDDLRQDRRVVDAYLGMAE